jgi:hypothetical protein
LGESNYTSPENFNRDLVRNCVGDSITGDDPTGFGRFTTKTLRIIFGPDTSVTPEMFWREVVFFNFVQGLVGDAARVRPTAQMWSDSLSNFIESMKTFRPERMLVLGLKNWQNLVGRVPHEGIGEFQADLLVGDHRIRAGYVHHPSSSLKYSDWSPIAKALLFDA